MTDDFHDLVRNRVTALPVAASRRAFALMVATEIRRWQPAPGMACTRGVPDLARLLRIGDGDMAQALGHLDEAGVVRQVLEGTETKLYTMAQGAGVLSVTLRDRITEAIGMHALWKRRLRHAMDSGRGVMSVEEIADDRSCDFGRWLHGPDFANVGENRDHEAVVYLHARFHEIAAETYRLALDGQRIMAERRMAPGGEFTEISLRLVKYLWKWRKDLV